MDSGLGPDQYQSSDLGKKLSILINLIITESDSIHITSRQYIDDFNSSLEQLC